MVENGGTATVTASISIAAGSDLTVNLGFAGTGTGGGTDYSRSSASIVITAGNTSGSITLTGVNDNLYEGDETIVVSVASTSGASVTDGSSAQTVTITDDDFRPRIDMTSSRAPTIYENGAPGTFTITYQLSTVAGVDVVFNIALFGPSTTATVGSDFTISSTTLTIPAGSLTASTTITVIDDASFEDTDETAYYLIQSATNADIDSDTNTTITIRDNDASGGLSCLNNGALYRGAGNTEQCFCPIAFSGTQCELPIAHDRPITISVSSNELTENSGTITMTISLAEPNPFGTTTVVVLNGGGSASLSDYSVSASPVVFNTNQVTKTVTLSATYDEIIEGDETFTVGVKTHSADGTSAPADFYSYNSSENETITIHDGIITDPVP